MRPDDPSPRPPITMRSDHPLDALDPFEGQPEREVWSGSPKEGEKPSSREEWVAFYRRKFGPKR